MRKAVQTERAPKAIGPYSQAIGAGGLLWVSGQIPIDPATGTLVEGGIEEQTRRVLLNISAILEAGGASLDRVVKVSVYLASLAEFDAMNRVYTTFFPSVPPARATVEVACLPRGARVEIDAVAITD
jgi:2-iminobutanoate/2-iminopropanoate deaminase